jgi:hypothetical protein
MKNSAPKPDPRAELQAVLLHKKYIYLNTVALRKWRDEFRQKVLIRAQAAHGAGPAESWQPAHFISNILPTVTPEFVACETALLFLENTAEFLEAKAEIEPLLASVAALEIEEAAAATRRSNLEQAHREAVASAEEKARAVALASPEVAAAAKALAAA